MPVEFQHIPSSLSSAVNRGRVSSLHVYPSPNVSLLQSPAFSFWLPVHRSHSIAPNEEFFRVFPGLSSLLAVNL